MTSSSGQDQARTSLPPDLDRLLHDLRGPLNSAVIHLEVVKRAGPGDPAAKQSLDTLAQELARLSRMLPAAFAVLAVEPREMATVDLREVAEQVVRERGGGTRVADGRWPPVRGDAGLLRLAVSHLLANALEATRAAGPGRPAPRLHVESAARAVTLVVRDWGPGLRSTNPRVAIRLSASQKPGRVGVGLVMVDRIARLHGGSLALATPPDGGAEARLTLPEA